MKSSIIKKEIKELNDRYYKLLYVYGKSKIVSILQEENREYEIINLNLLLSEKLLTISKKQYPLFVEDFVRSFVSKKDKVYLFEHIEILFDKELQINPVRLFENISKQFQIIIIWPGKYEQSTLIYAESDYPEYFTCTDFEGKVIH